MTIYAAVLFFLLSPGVLFRFPSRNPAITLGVHAALFAIIWQLTHKAVYQQIYGKEGFELSGGATWGIAIGVLILIIIIIRYIIKDIQTTLEAN
jgi:hypothetical protein